MNEHIKAFGGQGIGGLMPAGDRIDLRDYEGQRVEVHATVDNSVGHRRHNHDRDIIMTSARFRRLYPIDLRIGATEMERFEQLEEAMREPTRRRAMERLINEAYER